MTVKELKELLADAPDTMIVYVGSVTHLGMFAFQEPCMCDSGITELGPVEEGEHGLSEGAKIFALIPHGLGVSEDEIDEEGIKPPPEVLN